MSVEGGVMPSDVTQQSDFLLELALTLESDGCEVKGGYVVHLSARLALAQG
jgi:hypothetical protein